jgi:hypothetical protein
MLVVEIASEEGQDGIEKARTGRVIGWVSLLEDFDDPVKYEAEQQGRQGPALWDTADLKERISLTEQLLILERVANEIDEMR